jgi:hypothetical protein
LATDHGIVCGLDTMLAGGRSARIKGPPNIRAAADRQGELIARLPLAGGETVERPVQVSTIP